MSKKALAYSLPETQATGGAVAFPMLKATWRGGRMPAREQDLRDSLCRCGFWLAGAAPSPQEGHIRLDLARMAPGDTVESVLFQLRKALRPFGGRARIAVAHADFEAWKDSMRGHGIPLGGSGTRSFVTRADGGATVTKVFHPAALDYMRREIWARKAAAGLPGVCPMLEAGENWFTMPYVEQGWKWRDRGWNLYPLARLRRILRFMEALHARGIAMVDWAPGCFLFDADDNLHVVDFEYAHAPAAAAPPRTSPDMTGEGHDVQIPGCRAVSYLRDWQPVAGAGLDAVLDWPEPRLRARRALYLLLRRVPRFLNGFVKSLSKRLRRGLLRATAVRRGEGETAIACGEDGGGDGLKTAVFGPAAARLPRDVLADTDRVLAMPRAQKADLQNHNADVMVLSGWAVRYCHRFRYVKNVKEVWIRPVDFPLFLAAGVKYFLDGRMRFAGTARLGRMRLLRYALRDKKHRGISRRVFLPANVARAGFLKELAQEGVDYVLLRCSNRVDTMAEGDDLDLLVGDADAAAVHEKLSRRIGTCPVDVHTVSGTVPGVSDGVAYFPPHLARGVLDRAVVNDDGARVPSEEDHFLTLAYHAVYQKGPRSGLAARGRGGDTRLTRELARLAAALGIDCELSLSGLDAYLGQRGWRPALDTRCKLAANNAWLRDELRKTVLSGETPEVITVFVLREVVREWGNLDALRADIRDAGFETVAEHTIPEADKAAVGRNLRGGDWSRANWPRNAGWPWHLIVVTDPAPQAPGRAMRRKSEFITNARPNLFKESWRERVNGARPPQDRANFVHCSDSNMEAFEYIDAAFPDAGKVRETAARRAAALLSRGRRGREG